MRSLFSRRTMREELGAGLVLGLESVPDGLAARLLAGLNPVAGLYGYLVGTAVGTLATSSVFMGAVVVLRLRGKQDLGSTFIRVLTRYAQALNGVDSHLVLAGIDQRALRQLVNTGALEVIGEANVFAATTRVGESLQQARSRADELLDSQSR